MLSCRQRDDLINGYVLCRHCSPAFHTSALDGLAWCHLIPIIFVIVYIHSQEAKSTKYKLAYQVIPTFQIALFYRLACDKSKATKFF